jgi:DNA polymerase III subunit epsilon
MSRYVVVDVETTGLSKVDDRVIELGAVLIQDYLIVDEYTSLIDVDTTIHWAAQRVHGISREMLRGRPPPELVWPVFASFLGDSILLGHNVWFDREFIRRELARFGVRLENRSKCTVHLSRKLLPKLPNHRLETVARHLLGDLPQECQLHRALDDARLTAQVWLALRQIQENIRCSIPV